MRKKGPPHDSRLRRRFIRRVLKSKRAKKNILRGLSKIWPENYRIVGGMSSIPNLELNLLNKVYGSNGTFYKVTERDLIEQMYRVSRAEVYPGSKNARDRSKLTTSPSILLEDWLYEPDEAIFSETLDSELAVVEDLVVGVMFYLLGGFRFPQDEVKNKLNTWLEEDAQKLGREPKCILVLSGVSPGVIVRYMYFKLTSVLVALNRVFTVRPDANAAQIMYEKMELLYHDHKDETK